MPVYYAASGSLLITWGSIYLVSRGDKNVYGIPFGPGVFFVVFHFLYTVLPGVSAYFIYGSQLDEFLLISLLSSIFFAVSYIVSLKILSPKMFILPRCTRSERISIWFQVFLFFALFVLVLTLKTGSPISYFTMSYDDRIYMEDRWLACSLILLEISILRASVVLLRSRKFWRSSGLVTAFLVFSLFIGKRTPAVTVALPFGFLLLYYRVLSKRVLAIVFVFGLLFFQSYNVFRSAFTNSSSFLEVARRGAYLEMLRFTSGDLAAPVRNFIIIKDIDRDYFVSFAGESYISSFLFLLPAEFERGKGLGEKLTELAFSDWYAVGGGAAFGAVNEAYVNFGIWAPIAYFFWGMLISWYTKLISLRSFSVNYYIFMFSLLLTWTLAVHRNTFADSLKTTEVIFVLYGVVWMIWQVFCVVRRACLSLDGNLMRKSPFYRRRFPSKGEIFA